MIAGRDLQNVECSGAAVVSATAALKELARLRVVCEGATGINAVGRVSEPSGSKQPLCSDHTASGNGAAAG